MKQRLKSFVHLALAWMAYWRFGRPSRKLIVVGVTGTKGKSTTARLIASALEAGGHKVGLLSTVEFQVGDKRWMNDKKMTMLGRGQIQSMLRDMVESGCRFVVVETSSEGILQYRHYGLDYDIAVFTNLGTEHSERHGGFEKLRADKGKMFAELMRRPRKIIDGKAVEKISIVNADDENASFFWSFKADKKYAFGFNDKPENLPGEVQFDHFTFDGMRSAGDRVNFSLDPNWCFHLKIAGAFNAYNGAAAVMVGKSQGIELVDINLALNKVEQVAGRMEIVYDDGGVHGFTGIVDYAHEPMSFTALFTTLRSMTQGKVIAVIGSDGGGRDVGKRAKMGEIAGRLVDYVVVSDVNCFDEDPHQIAEMLAAGARKTGKKDGVDLFVEVDRRLGFRKAVSLAKPGDVVVVTAKGTEPCIVVAGGKKIPWDDRQVLREEIERLPVIQ